MLPSAGNSQETTRPYTLVAGFIPARAQAQFDRPAAMRSYQQLLDIWKNADSDFIPAQEAKRELGALSQSKN